VFVVCARFLKSNSTVLNVLVQKVKSAIECEKNYLVWSCTRYNSEYKYNVLYGTIVLPVASSKIMEAHRHDDVVK
jgi:hypothetical protein